MNIDHAIWVAWHAHQGQVRFNGEPYIMHPLRVMHKVDSPVQKVVAVLHDVPEMYGWHSDILTHCNHHVIECLRLLTRREGTTYMQYIENIKHSRNFTAITVKVADIHDNLLDTTSSLRKRYTKALQCLNEW